MQKNVSDYIADFLAARNIRYVFGIVGAGNANIFDAIARKGFTEIICVHHEQAATMAMQAYYKITGQVTAAIVTSGGGSTNAVTGVVSAWMDSIPSVVISGNDNSKFSRADNPLRIWGVQSYDSTAMVSRVTKYAHRVMNPEDIISELQTAFFYASNGRPGPCWLDIPMNVQSAPVDEKKLSIFNEPELTLTPLADNVITNVDIAVEKVLELLQQSKRPLLWLGNGIRLAGGTKLIEPLLQTLQCPALLSWAGIDMISHDNPFIMGRAGVYGQRASNFILQNCDFLLTIGVRLSVQQIGYDINEFAPAAKIAVVDIDPAEVAKHGARINLPLLADAKKFIEQLQAKLTKTSIAAKTAWYDRCVQYRKDFPRLEEVHNDKDGFINSYKFLVKFSDFFTEDQVIVTDMGTALLGAYQILHLKYKQRLITSTGLGEMGYGLPAAIGASFARNKGEVVCLNCDGGMMLNLQELQTIVHHQLPIKIIVFNNDGYLMIKHTQKALFEGRYICTNKETGVSCPNFTALAKAFGISAYQIRSWQDFDQYIPEVMNAKGPVICEVFMHPEQLFMPKLSVAKKSDGTLISPPLEDLSPLLSREELKKNMIIDINPKSEQLEV